MLNNHSFKNNYNSKEDRLIYDFYVPALKNSVLYDRISAYFDSKILRMYASGLDNICNNNGKIRFIFSCDISDEDYELMLQGYSLRKEYEEKLLFSLSEEDINVDLGNLAYLIGVGVIDIKIAFTKSGIFHDKYGLFTDKMGNKLYFRGSNNETVAAVLNNYESFETTKSWECDANEQLKIIKASNDFEKLWNNDIQGVYVVPLPECVRNKILSYSPKSINYIYNNKENSLIFDILDGNFYIINNLYDKTLYSKQSRIYQFKLRYFVKEYNDDKIWLKNISYIKLNELIRSLSMLGEEFGYNVFVTPMLQEYLYNKDIMIDKRKSLGIAIKHCDSLVQSDFEKFKTIVNQELVRQLREPQMVDAYHFVSMIRAANFSVPGAGKTSIVYGAFAYLQYIGKVNKILMIGPKNSFNSWKKEFVNNFGNKKSLNCLDIQESFEYGKRNALKYFSDDKNLILVNYESVPGLIDELTPLIDDNTLLVFDEIHRIKGVGGKRAEACLKISDLAQYKIALTGTPIPNSYSDLYNLLHILYPEEYDTFFDFKMNELKNAYKSPEIMEKINNAIYPFFCRTTKRDLNVPLPYDDDIETGYIDMDEDEEHIMEIIYNTYHSNILLLYIRLLQASSNPALVLEKIEVSDFISPIEDDENDDYSFISGLINDDNITMSTEDFNFISNHSKTRKIDKSAEIIKSLVQNGEKVVAWGMFVKNLFLLDDKLKQLGIKSVVISGAMPQSERDIVIDGFENNVYDVIITNPHTLAESISLHKVCHYALYFEYSFNLTHMLQSRDRIHRLGITEDERPHYIYMFLSRPESMYDTIDQKIYYRLKEKEKVMIDAVENAEVLYFEDSYVDDIEYILNN